MPKGAPRKQPNHQPSSHLLYTRLLVYRHGMMAKAEKWPQEMQQATRLSKWRVLSAIFALETGRPVHRRVGGQLQAVVATQAEISGVDGEGDGICTHEAGREHRCHGTALHIAPSIAVDVERSVVRPSGRRRDVRRRCVGKGIVAENFGLCSLCEGVVEGIERYQP